MSIQKRSSDKVKFPVPPSDTGYGEAENMTVYARFMRHLRDVPCSRTDIKILSSIQFTADFLDYSDAHVAKVLVDLGLRAPRGAFSSDFLRFADSALMRSGWEIGGPNAALLELKDHWADIGESVFAAVTGDYEIAGQRALL